MKKGLPDAKTNAFIYLRPAPQIALKFIIARYVV